MNLQLNYGKKERSLMFKLIGHSYYYEVLWSALDRNVNTLVTDRGCYGSLVRVGTKHNLVYSTEHLSVCC